MLVPADDDDDDDVSLDTRRLSAADNDGRLRIILKINDQRNRSLG